MSIRIMSAIWDGGPIGSANRFVLLAIADNADDDGACWPSIATIARKTGISPRTVQRAIRQLEVEGWLVTSLSAGRKGANVYRINLDPTPVTMTPCHHDTPVTMTPPPCHHDTPTPVTMTPEPSYNHQEPSLFGGDAPKPRRRKPECELPEGWVPSEKNNLDAIDRGFTEKEIHYEADRFRDHHTAKGTRFRNWDAAWRTWLGNARKFAGSGMAGKAGPGGRGQGGSIASIVARRRLAGAD